MKRDIEQELLSWKQQKQCMPILLRGARQVGKSFTIEQFGKAYFDNLVVANFELRPELKQCFNTRQPHEILLKLSLMLHQEIIPGRTLLFLDEIQDCPDAIIALRYFKELLPDLHVIGAGSLLEFTLNSPDFRTPVGRVQSLYLKPLSFKEFLSALGYHDLRKLIEATDVSNPITEPVHQELLKWIRYYMALGGMPGVLQDFLSSERISFGNMSRSYDIQKCQAQQTILLNGYRQDFGKYAKHHQVEYVQKVFEKAPGLVGGHVKYSKIDPDTRAQNVKSALSLLEYAGLICPIYSTAASGIPLATLMNEKKFKILFLDIGLMTRTTQVATQLLLDDDIILVNRGAIAEQLVGQELLAYAPYIEEPRLYFWCREKKSSMAEVDFITTVDSTIVPIEVKAGSTGKLKSLQLLMDEKKLEVGVRVSQNSLSLEGRILSVPFYMIGEISRLVKAL